MTIPESPSPSPTAASRRSRRATIGIVVLLLLVWVSALYFRMEIRAHWWAWRITRVEEPADRTYYAACLASIGDRSLGALPRLLNDSQASVRLLGVHLLRSCKGERSLGYLLQRLDDPSTEVSDAAILEIALRPDRDKALPALRTMLAGPAPAALTAMAALERIGGSRVEAILLDKLKSASDPDVIAQAIESLGMLACAAAESAIRDHLTDMRPLTRPPATQRRADRVIAAVSGKLVAQGIDPRGVAAASRTDLTVAAVAIRALALIAGHSSSRPAASASGPASRASPAHR